MPLGNLIARSKPRRLTHFGSSYICKRYIERRARAIKAYTDITLLVGPEKTEIHSSRFLLAACSGFFVNYLAAEEEGKWEQEPGRRRTVTLPTLDERVVHFLLAGLLDGCVFLCDDSELEPFFHAVEYLKIHEGDNLCLAACQVRSLPQAKRGRVDLAAFLAKVIDLAERYNQPRVANFVWHLIFRDTMLHALEKRAWPLPAAHEAALDHIRVLQAKGVPAKCNLLMKPPSACTCKL